LNEEYSAFYLSTRISWRTRMNFKAYDPLKPGCLKRWFSDHYLLHGVDGRDPYMGIDLYPPGVAETIDNSDPSCLLEGEIARPVAP
jgi:hypothetical protein